MRCDFRDAWVWARVWARVWAEAPRLTGKEPTFEGAGTPCVCRKKQDFVFLKIISTIEMRTYHDIPRPEFTPERITELKADEIFVFGSNLAGMHGGGAGTIKPYVDAFIDFAKAHPELFFYVTRIGCGIAGFRDSEIAPLFSAARAVENICLPESFTR